MTRKNGLFVILAVACVCCTLTLLAGCSDDNPPEPQPVTRGIDVLARGHICGFLAAALTDGARSTIEFEDDSVLATITTSVGNAYHAYAKYADTGMLAHFDDIPTGSTRVDVESRWTWPVYSAAFELGESNQDTTIIIDFPIVTSDPTVVTIGFYAPTTSQQEKDVIETLNNMAARTSKPLILDNLTRKDYGYLVAYTIPLAPEWNVGDVTLTMSEIIENDPGMPSNVFVEPEFGWGCPD